MQISKLISIWVFRYFLRPMAGIFLITWATRLCVYEKSEALNFQWWQWSSSKEKAFTSLLWSSTITITLLKAPQICQFAFRLWSLTFLLSSPRATFHFPDHLVCKLFSNEWINQHCRTLIENTTDDACQFIQVINIF